MNPIQRSQVRVSQSDSQQSPSLGSRTIASSGEIWIASAIEVKRLLLNSFIEWILNNSAGWNNMYALTFFLLHSVRFFFFLPLKPFGKNTPYISFRLSILLSPSPTRSTDFLHLLRTSDSALICTSISTCRFDFRSHECKIAGFLIERL